MFVSPCYSLFSDISKRYEGNFNTRYGIVNNKTQSDRGKSSKEI